MRAKNLESRLTGPIEAILFDLDGTLVDSAPDLIAAVQRLRAERGLPPADGAAVGAVVSKGGRAMLRRGFPEIDERDLEALLPRFLDCYAEAIAIHTRTYPGIAHVLDAIEAHGWPWGVVTNKPGRLARSLLAALALEERCATLVTGDCLATRKPDPAPILHACVQLGVPACRIVYVGDDPRDIEAGRRAGAQTVVAGWGYLDGEDPESWRADAVAATPQALLSVLGLDESPHARIR